MLFRVAEEGLEQSFILIIQLSALSETEFVDILRQAEPSIHAVQIIGNPAENHIALNHLSSAHGNAFRGKQLLAFAQRQRLQMNRPGRAVIKPAIVVKYMIDNPDLPDFVSFNGTVDDVRQMADGVCPLVGMSDGDVVRLWKDVFDFGISKKRMAEDLRVAKDECKTSFDDMAWNRFKALKLGFLNSRKPKDVE